MNISKSKLQNAIASGLIADLVGMTKSEFVKIRNRLVSLRTTAEAGVGFSVDLERSLEAPAIEL